MSTGYALVWTHIPYMALCIALVVGLNTLRKRLKEINRRLK